MFLTERRLQPVHDAAFAALHASLVQEYAPKGLRERDIVLRMARRLHALNQSRSLQEKQEEHRQDSSIFRRHQAHQQRKLAEAREALWATRKPRAD